MLLSAAAQSVISTSSSAAAASTKARFLLHPQQQQQAPSNASPTTMTLYILPKPNASAMTTASSAVPSNHMSRIASLFPSHPINFSAHSNAGSDPDNNSLWNSNPPVPPQRPAQSSTTNSSSGYVGWPATLDKRGAIVTVKETFSEDYGSGGRVDKLKAAAAAPSQCIWKQQPFEQKANGIPLSTSFATPTTASLSEQWMPSPTAQNSQQHNNNWSQYSQPVPDEEDAFDQFVQSTTTHRGFNNNPQTPLRNGSKTTALHAESSFAFSDPWTTVPGEAHTHGSASFTLLPLSKKSLAYFQVRDNGFSNNFDDSQQDSLFQRHITRDRSNHHPETTRMQYVDVVSLFREQEQPYNKQYTHIVTDGVSSLRPVIVAPITSDTLVAQNHSLPPLHTPYAASKGYHGLLDKTKDVPFLMDEEDSLSLSMSKATSVFESAALSAFQMGLQTQNHQDGDQ